MVVVDRVGETCSTAEFHPSGGLHTVPFPFRHMRVKYGNRDMIISLRLPCVAAPRSGDDVEAKLRISAVNKRRSPRSIISRCGKREVTVMIYDLSRQCRKRTVMVGDSCHTRLLYTGSAQGVQ